MLVIVTKSADDVIASLRAKVSAWSVADADRFIADFTGNNDAINRFVNGFASPDAWKIMDKAGRANLKKDIKLLEKLSDVRTTNGFGGSNVHWTDDDFIAMFKKHAQNGRGGVKITDDFGIINEIAQGTLSAEDLLTVFQKIKKSPVSGIEKVLSNLKNTDNYYIGAEWVLRYTHATDPASAADLWSKIARFEEKVQNGARVIDIVFKEKPLRRELKSWAYFAEAYKPTFIKQFKNDLDGIATLDEMAWIFDKKGKFTNPTYLKEKVLETLASPEERAALQPFVSNGKLQSFFQSPVFVPITTVDNFITELSKDINFNAIFK